MSVGPPTDKTTHFQNCPASKSATGHSVGFRSSVTGLGLGLCGPLVLVDETAENGSPLDPLSGVVGDGAGGRGGGPGRAELARTASNDAVNCPARSRTMNRKSTARSPRSISRFRICCAVHGPTGFASSPSAFLVGDSRRSPRTHRAASPNGRRTGNAYSFSEAAVRRTRWRALRWRHRPRGRTRPARPGAGRLRAGLWLPARPQRLPPADPSGEGRSSRPADPTTGTRACDERGE